METMMMGFIRGYIGVTLGLYCDNGKYNGNNYIILGYRGIIPNLTS